MPFEISGLKTSAFMPETFSQSSNKVFRVKQVRSDCVTRTCTFLIFDDCHVRFIVPTSPIQIFK